MYPCTGRRGGMYYTPFGPHIFTLNAGDERARRDCGGRRQKASETNKNKHPQNLLPERIAGSTLFSVPLENTTFYSMLLIPSFRRKFLCPSNLIMAFKAKYSQSCESTFRYSKFLEAKKKNRLIPKLWSHFSDSCTKFSNWRFG
jgi:hypothetical protein